MKILKSVIDKIDFSIAALLTETGGIIGSKNKDLVDEVIMDIYNENIGNPCSYSPNIDFFNLNINLWQKNEIHFMGLFHTHFFGIKTLSPGDKDYIKNIMKVMPKHINALYFPIYVLPNREMVCYRAELKNKIVEINQEDIQIELDIPLS